MRNDVTTELYAGPALGWIDVTDDTRHPDADSGGGHTITRVAGDPGELEFTLNNAGGRYSARNPRSDLYGVLGQNTPVRVGVVRLVDAFDVADGPEWTPDWLMVGAGSPIDFPAEWSTVGGRARHSVPRNSEWRASLYTPATYLDVEVRTRVQIHLVDVTGDTIEPANIILRSSPGMASGYYMARVEVAASQSVSISLHHTAGVIAGAILVSGLVYTGQPLDVAASCVGDRLAIKVWDAAAGGEPRDWQLTATDTRITGPGLVGVRSGLAAGNTNGKPVAFDYEHVTVLDRRAVMELASTPTRWLPGGADVWTPVTANGITRRLGQGAKPLDSPLTRRIPHTNPVAWWPLEDGTSATAAASGIPGAAPLIGPEVANGLGGDGPPGASGGMNPPAGTTGLLGPVPAGVTPDSFTVSVWTRASVQDVTKVAGYTPIEWTSQGGAERWQLNVQSGAEDALTGVVDPNVFRVSLTNGASGFPPFTARVADGQWHLLSIGMQQQGGTVAAWLYVDGVQVDADTRTGTLLAPDTVRVPGYREGAPAFNLSANSVGHAQIHNGPFPPDEMAAGRGHAGEPAADRMARLCAEQGVPIVISRGPDPTPAMGVQTPATFLDLLGECVDVDAGVFGEARESLSLTYRCLGFLVNRPAAALPYPVLAPPLEPLDDDQGMRNDVEIKRAGGSSARAVLPPDHPRSPESIGTYDVSLTRNLARDDQAAALAWWTLHVGSWDEARYPRVRVDLASPRLATTLGTTGVDALTATDRGDALALDQLPDWLPPGPTSQLVTGTVEVLWRHGRRLDWTMTPAGPYTVATADGDPRVPADGSALAVALSSSATTLSVSSTPTNGPWAPDWPLAVRVGGERVTATAVAPALRDNFGRAVPGWGNPDIGPPWDAPVSGSHVNSTVGVFDIKTPSYAISAATHVDFDIFVRYIKLTVQPTGDNAEVHVEMRYVDDNHKVAARLFYLPSNQMTFNIESRSGGVSVPASPVFPGVPSAASTTPVSLRFQGQGNTLRLMVWPEGTPPPLTWQHTETANHVAPGSVRINGNVYGGNTNAAPYFLEVDGVELSTPQTLTLSARGVNGVQRAWPAGTPVDVWVPAVAGP